MTPLEKAIIEVCNKFHQDLLSVEEQTVDTNNRLQRLEEGQIAQTVLLNHISQALGSLNDLVRQQYSVTSEALSSLGARVKTSEALMKGQNRPRAIKVVEKRGSKNESDER